MAKKSKYTRRRAIDCKLIERSKNNPGYCKYMITIAELDGTIHKQPAYGKDMQGALARLMNTELTVKVERKLETNVGLIFLAWLLIMGVPAILLEGQGTPWMLAYTFGTILILVVVCVLWYSYIQKGRA
jgi:hypothetical protein|tara:strand:+ start:1136 stop:1522 length:387 start_codon:yes stop_codon:yes gene_type:complete